MLMKFIGKLFPKLEKLLVILDTIDNIKVMEDKSLYIKFKSNLAIETENNALFYSNKGVAVIKSSMLYIQPNIDKKNFTINNSKNFIELNNNCYNAYLKAQTTALLKNMKFSKEIEHDHTTDKKQRYVRI